VRRIEPITGDDERPFWSVMIPTRDCGPWLEASLSSVRDQDPGPEKMQIAVVDDASDGDRAQQITRRIFGERAEYHRHPVSLGIAGNWNACVDLSRGHWVHVLHQDDLVLPGFYERLERAALVVPEVGAAFCRNWTIDRNGARTGISALERDTAGLCGDWLERIAESNRVQCPAVVVRRRCYEQLGGFRSDLSFTLDWEMWVRIASRWPFYYEPEPLSAFRIHVDSETSRLCRDGSNVADLLSAIEIINGQLPPQLRSALRDRARRYCVRHALGWARRLLNAKETAAARIQLRAALELDPMLLMRAHVWNLYRQLAFGMLRDRIRRADG
jgi:glycosyltransferase involved in cell wall biosynthesis